MATIPTGYTEAKANFYYFSDGTGPYVIDDTGTAILANTIKIGAGLSGGLAQFNRLAGGVVAQKFLLGADGLPTGWVGPGIIYSIRCLTGPGVIAGLYDAASAAGTNLMPALATAANTVYSLGAPGEGILFDISPFFDWTSGTYVVYGVPAL